MNDRWTVGIDGGAIVPLSGVRAHGGDARTDWFGGVSLRHSSGDRRPALNLTPQAQPRVSWHTTFESRHYFRGVERIGRDPVVGTTMEYGSEGWIGGFSWFNVAEENRAESSAFLGYSYALGNFDLSAGLARNWAQENRRRDPAELFIDLKADPLVWGVSPSARYYLRLDRDHWSYGEVSLDRSFSLHEADDISVYMLLGFGDLYSRAYRLNHAECGVRTRTSISEDWSLGLSGGAIIPLDSVRAFSGNSKTGGFVALSVQWCGKGANHERWR